MSGSAPAPSSSRPCRPDHTTNRTARAKHRSAIEEGRDRLELRGTSASFDASLGVVISKNLALHATAGAWSIVNPTAEFNGPSNVYVTASAGAALLPLEIGRDEQDSDTGFAFQAGIGPSSPRPG